ncbi:hypothetical protein [Photobacterium rosenbergii]|uniref:DUF3955 domain-containing protein n=1 Tax=Photobacterium rosenbergii TaxID=294936 RepID=A0ABU3ZMG2_9GAMM|nr:hypothetical protein [Photobacterium rosenbergii]MDV5171173.1 hypothetical protein [Photobacterium rosenbergii]
MSIASYLLFGILGLLIMLIIQGVEAVVMAPEASSGLILWLLLDGIWLTLIAIGLYQWCKSKPHKH